MERGKDLRLHRVLFYFSEAFLLAQKCEAAGFARVKFLLCKREAKFACFIFQKLHLRSILHSRQAASLAP